MGELENLPNIGVTIEEQLNAVGITTYEQLKSIGSKQAWLKIKAIDASACTNRLYALEGAIQGIKKIHLSTDIKAELREFYDTFKG
jgi:DNA transformation protein